MSLHNVSAFLRELFEGDGPNKGGAPKCRPIAPTEWLLNGAPLASGSGAIQIGACATSLYGVVWQATATTTDILTAPLHLPFDFADCADSPSALNRLLFRAKMRVVGTGGTANDDIKVQAQATAHSLKYSDERLWTETDGEAALATLSTPPTVSIGARVVDASEDKFRWLEWDLSAAMTKAQRVALRGGSCFQIGLSADQLVAANNTIQMVAAELWYPAHLTIPNRFARSRMFG